jgi:Xaa-Pro aminopeptidase
MTDVVRRLPHPADFASPPCPGDLRRWIEGDRVARPLRVAKLRARLERAGVDAYFGLRSEHMRYLTGFALDDGEEKVAGNSGRFLISGDQVVVLADSRYRLQAAEQAPAARVEAATYDLAAGWPALLKSVGAKRVAVEAGLVSHQLWEELRAAAPDVELVPISGWLEDDRAVKEHSEIERIEAACSIADRALASILRRIKAGVPERELALALEWEMRTTGGDALAFGVACLAGPNAALPHGKPSKRFVCSGEVLLFDFGTMVQGYRSDMTRTLFVGEPTARDLALYETVAEAQAATIKMIEAAAHGERPVPSGREADVAARAVIETAGYGENFGHGTGHGIGLATHELPSLSRTASQERIQTPAVFSVEPGIYLDGETGIRIEDLIAFDPSKNRAELLTHFPREVVVVGV